MPGGIVARPRNGMETRPAGQITAIFKPLPYSGQRLGQTIRITSSRSSCEKRCAGLANCTGLRVQANLCDRPACIDL